jgi:hypothetical protein
MDDNNWLAQQGAQRTASMQRVCDGLRARRDAMVPDDMTGTDYVYMDIGPSWC